MATSTKAGAVDPARAKANLDALCKQLGILIPLQLALGAGLMAGEAAITVSGAKLPLGLAQLLVVLSTSIAILHCARLSFALSRDLGSGLSAAKLRQLLSDDPFALNPFYSLPAGPKGFWSSVAGILAALPLSGLGLVVGFAGSFLFPLTSGPGIPGEALGFLILGVALLHAGAFGAVFFGLMAMLISFGEWWRVAVLVAAIAAGLLLGNYVVQVVQDIRTQAAVISSPASVL
jgi:hypothetical protein